MNRIKWYVGINGTNRVAFPSRQTPTADTTPYAAVVGPFRTKRAAIWVENNGYNGWYQDVNNAERLAKG